MVTIGLRIAALDFEQTLMSAASIAAVLDGPALRIIAGRPVGEK